MSDDTPSPLNNVITIDDERIKSHLDRVVRGTVEETLNALLDGDFLERYTRAREAQAHKLFREIIEIADDASGDYVTTRDGKNIVDHENIQRSRLRVDARKWAAARLAPKKYGDRISHDVKGPGANFQPAILIQVGDGSTTEFEVPAPTEAGSGVLLDGNGDIVRTR
jgi:hypothetical protein